MARTPKTKQLDREIGEISRADADRGSSRRRPVARSAPPIAQDPGLVITAARLLAEARNAHRDYWFGDRKVFLAAIVDVTDPAAMEILEECRRAGLLKFSRADYVAAMDPEMVAASEWVIDGWIVVHFIEVT